MVPGYNPDAPHRPERGRIAKGLGMLGRATYLLAGLGLGAVHAALLVALAVAFLV